MFVGDGKNILRFFKSDIFSIGIRSEDRVATGENETSLNKFRD